MDFGRLLFAFITFLLTTSCVNNPKIPDYLLSLQEEWNNAGSTIDNEAFINRKITLTPKKSDVLQFKIDSLSEAGGGTIFLEEGNYKFKKTVSLKSNIFLKGKNKNSVKLLFHLEGNFTDSPFNTKSGVDLDRISNVVISDIQIEYHKLNFPPYAGAYFSDIWNKKNYSNNPKGDSLTYVSLLSIKHSKNIKISNCKIINSGTDPVIIANSSFVTFKNSKVQGSYNKGGKGNGYFNIDKGSHHVLIKNNSITKLRHLAIQNGAFSNVVYDNYLEVDVNFHNGDGGKNLIEQNIIRIPEWHGWHVFARGAKSKHHPPGKNNYLFNNLTQYKLKIPGVRNKITEYGDSIIYKSQSVIDTLIVKNQPMIRYTFGEIDLNKSKHQNKLFEMNASWTEKQSARFVEKLNISRIYESK